MGSAGGRTGERVLDTDPEDMDKLKGVTEEALAGSDERGVIEARGERDASDVNGEVEGGTVLSLSSEESDDTLDALGRNKDVSYEASGRSRTTKERREGEGLRIDDS